MTATIAFALLWLLVFSIPWEKSITLGGLGTLTRLLGSVALVGGVLDAAIRRTIRPPHLALILTMAFTLWSGTTWWWSADPDATATRALTLVQLCLMSWLCWQLCRTPAQQRALLGAYTAGAAVASLATIARYAGNLQTYYRRYAAPGFDPNDLGLTVALAIPVALYLASSRSGPQAWLWRAAVLLCGAAILLTASRTALLCAFAAFLFVPLAWSRSTPVARWSGIALLALFLAGAVKLAPKESRTRIATIGQEITKGTLHKRTTIWKAGLRAWKAHPLSGVGSGAYPDAVRPLIGVPGVPGHEYVAHNTFLSVLVETGLVGFALYAAGLAVFVAFILAMRPHEAALWSVVLAVWLLGASTLTWEHRKAAWILLALLACEWSRAFLAPPARGARP